jgi:hypothetical protein
VLAKSTSIGYRTVDGIDQIKTTKLHEEIVSGQVAPARAEYAAYRPKIAAALAALNAGEDVLEAADRVRDAATNGAADWKDYTAYLPQLAAAAAKIEQAIAELKGPAR